ncbi:MAG: M48 family metalloprotease [Legionella sp.]|uniref:M48 family metalloprotease n=1 Tax=Legionella sp. TaxID=459 RepID=UPI0039E50965
MIRLKIKKKISWIIFACLLTQSVAAATLSPYSTSELEQLEKEFVQQINQSDSVERNPLTKEYVNRIGKNLARQGHIHTPDFFIVKSNEINAFAGPGGHIGINTQLMLITSNESELAGVMAHEIAHVRLHHLYSAIEHQRQMRIPMLASMLASIALGVINPTVGMGAMMGSLSGFSQESINFTRLKEKEADRIGIDMLIKAGYNPQSMAAFFQKMQENSRYYYTVNVPAILRTHPLDSDRIAEAQNRTTHITKKEYSSSMDYYLVKEIIRTDVAYDPKTLLEYYAHQCSKVSPAIACQYGLALTWINLNNFTKARDLLSPLLAQQNTMYFQIAMAQVETGLLLHQQAVQRLTEMQTNYPGNYAVLMAYSQALLAANQNEKATSVLLKGSRLYKQDLPLCKELARAQAKSHRKSYAYFTQAQCLLLEGQKRAAVAQLKVARGLAKNDEYLQARISAKIEEITN